MTKIWLIKLILSHLLTDFVLQPKKWVTDRIEKRFRSVWLYVHAFVTAAIAFLFIGMSYWRFAVVIFFTHLLIDGWKSTRPQNVSYFFIDQLLHLLVITGCWYAAFYTPDDVKELWKYIAQNDQFWILLTAYVFLSFPTGIVIGQLTRKWSEKLRESQGVDKRRQMDRYC